MYNKIHTIYYKKSLILLTAIIFISLLTKEIDSKQDLQQEETLTMTAEHRSFPETIVPHPSIHGTLGPSAGQSDVLANEPWPVGRPDVAQIKAINVKCEKSLMKVNIEFDRPFFGLIFSKGHYSDPKCVHLPQGSGQLQANFEIYLGGCGMSSSEQNSNTAVTTSTSSPGVGLFIENTIIIQYDPQVQEIWDQARRLRCTWYDYYEKAVSFRPFNVDMLDAVTANFLGDNIQCWMQIQVGKGPWASEVAGIVKIGQTMTMVLAIKDDENKFDMLVRNCIAHDSKHQPIQLVDEFGCVVRPKIMSRFQKVKNFGHSATVVSYAYFQAFKFPDSMNVHFQCVIQVCRFECPEPTCDGDVNTEYNPAPRDQSLQFSESKPNYAVSGHKQSGPKPNSNSQFLNRKGEITPTVIPKNGQIVGSIKSNISRDYSIAGTGGMPRSLKLDSRKKRQTLQMKDIKTQRIIQVVAPGDVAFTLPLSADNETNFIDVLSNRLLKNDNLICMSTTGFTAGLVLLFLLLILSCLVTVFLFIRLRNIPKKMSPMQCTCVNENPYYMQIPSVSTVHIASVS
ncbi:cuticlin-4-like [Oppia nitens]|uniref:cuticlin-4-like n=1 Tax=Oppia nitens TaxID=1686743 RepID=UPI0023DAC810|nr:cuticlin-4-like [Oppia nitens]